MAEFLSLEAALEDHFKKQESELPLKIRKHPGIAGPPAGNRGARAFRSGAWDLLAPGQRRELARQWDIQNDPAREEENETLFSLFSSFVNEILDLKNNATFLEKRLKRLEQRSNVGGKKSGRSRKQKAESWHAKATEIVKRVYEKSPELSQDDMAHAVIEKWHFASDKRCPVKHTAMKLLVARLRREGVIGPRKRSNS